MPKEKVRGGKSEYGKGIDEIHPVYHNKRTLGKSKLFPAHNKSYELTVRLKPTSLGIHLMYSNGT